MSRAAYTHPPAQTDGRNHDQRAEDTRCALAADALLERESAWPFPAQDVDVPTKGRRHREPLQITARRS